MEDSNTNQKTTGETLVGGGDGEIEKNYDRYYGDGHADIFFKCQNQHKEIIAECIRLSIDSHVLLDRSNLAIVLKEKGFPENNIDEICKTVSITSDDTYLTKRARYD